MVKTRGTSGQTTENPDNGPDGSLQKSRGKATTKVPLAVARQQQKKLLEKCLEDIKTNKLTPTQAQNRQQHIDARSGPGTALGPVAEARLLQHISVMRRHGRTLTKIEVLCLAAELEAIEAKAAGRKPRWAPGAAASEKWWRGYKNRHGVVLLQPCDQTFGSFKRKLGSLRALTDIIDQQPDIRGAMPTALEVLADAAAAAAAGDGQGAVAAVAAAFDAVLEAPSPVPLRLGAQVKPRFITGAEMAAVLRRRAVEREMKEILAGARQYFRDLSPDSKRELKASNRSRGQVSGKRSRSAGRQPSATDAGARNLKGVPVPRPRRAAQVPLRYRQSADFGRDDRDSQSSEQDDTASETSSDTASSESEN